MTFIREFFTIEEIPKFYKINFAFMVCSSVHWTAASPQVTFQEQIPSSNFQISLTWENRIRDHPRRKKIHRSSSWWLLDRETFKNLKRELHTFSRKRHAETQLRGQCLDLPELPDTRPRHGGSHTVPKSRIKTPDRTPEVAQLTENMPPPASPASLPGA